MKYLAAVLALAGSGAFAAPPAQRAPVQPPADLRQSLHQFQVQPARGTGALPPRQLSAVERAELRRQISEYSQPSAWRR